MRVISIEKSQNQRQLVLIIPQWMGTKIFWGRFVALFKKKMHRVTSQDHMYILFIYLGPSQHHDCELHRPSTCGDSTVERHGACTEWDSQTYSVFTDWGNILPFNWVTQFWTRPPLDKVCKAPPTCDLPHLSSKFQKNILQWRREFFQRQRARLFFTGFGNIPRWSHQNTSRWR